MSRGPIFTDYVKHIIFAGDNISVALIIFDRNIWLNWSYHCVLSASKTALKNTTYIKIGSMVVFSNSKMPFFLPLLFSLDVFLKSKSFLQKLSTVNHQPPQYSSSAQSETPTTSLFPYFPHTMAGADVEKLLKFSC